MTTTFPAPASLERISAADAIEFHRRWIKPGAASLTFAGDIGLEDAVKLAREELGGWQGAAERTPPLPPPSPSRGKVFLMERKGAAQTYIVQMLPAIPRTHPDFAALALVDRILGGMFSSRLMTKLRVEKRYAYEAGSSFTLMPGHGVWFATSPVQADRTKEALDEFVAELRGLAGDRPIMADELARAKSHLIQEYWRSFESSSGAAEAISRHWAAGLSVEDIRTWPDKLAAASLDAVNVAARKYAKPGKQVFLLNGDHAVIERAVRESGLGAVESISPDGLPAVR